MLEYFMTFQSPLKTSTFGIVGITTSTQAITLPWQASVKLLLLTQSLLSWIRLKPNLRSPQGPQWCR